MSENLDQKLHFDLRFLDGESTEAAERRERYEHIKNVREPEKENHTTRNIIVAVVVIVIFLYLSQSGNNTNNNSTTGTKNTAPTNGPTYVQIGDFQCTSAVAAVADTMAPSQTESTYLDTELARLNNVANTLTATKNRLSTEYVDKTNQFSINMYNNDVDAYNAALQQYKTQSSAYTTRSNAYNSALGKFNSYISANCIPFKPQ